MAFEFRSIQRVPPSIVVGETVFTVTGFYSDRTVSELVQVTA